MSEFASVASAIIAALGLVGGFIAWRERALRRGEVLHWANECIAELQSIVLLCDETLPLWDTASRLARLQAAAVKTSILVERGRLFFRNKPSGGWGDEQEPAYRGLRPVVLDQLVLAHQVACALASPGPVDAEGLKHKAEDARKRFVSLCQQEVGRSRSAAVNPAKGGESVSLARELGTPAFVSRRSVHHLR